MPYRLTYQVNIDWVGSGTGVQNGNVAPPLPQGGRGGAQTLEIPNKQGGQNSVTFLAADIASLVGVASAAGGGMAADIWQQLTNNLARIQGFASGGG